MPFLLSSRGGNREFVIAMSKWAFVIARSNATWQSLIVRAEQKTSDSHVNTSCFLGMTESEPKNLFRLKRFRSFDRLRMTKKKAQDDKKVLGMTEW